MCGICGDGASLEAPLDPAAGASVPLGWDWALPAMEGKDREDSV